MERELHNLGLISILLALLFLTFGRGLVGASRSWEKDAKQLNAPDFTLHTIERDDGDIVDCVDIYRQPAFNHPSLKNHTIQMAPSSFPVPLKEEEATPFAEQVSKVVQTTEGCPEGTIPILRTRISDPSILVKKGRAQTRIDGSENSANTDAVNDGHEHAVVYSNSRKYYGAKASLNVWNPRVERAGEFSLAQLWVVSGSFVGRDLDSVEAGWMVNPSLFGDSATRFFTYWTNSNYQGSGCYNHFCSGFVQTNRNLPLGAKIQPTSTYNGAQYVSDILIFKDPRSRNWWLVYHDIAVGYWPSSLFRRLADSSSLVEWGGEVVNNGNQGSHTATQMGSGHFPNVGFRKASFISRLQIVDESNKLIVPPGIRTTVEASNCYGLETRRGGNGWGNYFYYGGPGRSASCR